MEIPNDKRELEDLQRHLEAFMLEILRTLAERSHAEQEPRPPLA